MSDDGSGSVPDRGQPPTPSTSTSTSTTSVIQAVKPKIGNLAQGKAWTGGEPTSTAWTSTKSTRPYSGYAYRTSVDYRQYGARLRGIEPKFCFKTTPGPDDMSLTTFAVEVKRHLLQHGMDSIFYVEDSQGEMHDIITSHALYTIDDVLAGIQLYEKKYDEYDMDNLNDSGTFLLSSIDTNLKKLITPFLRDVITGPEVWIRIVGEVQSSSVERMMKVAADLDKVRVKSFKGENVKQYASHVIQQCRDLEYGESLPRNVCLTIVDQLIDVSVEKFRVEFLSLRPAVVEELRSYHGRSMTAIRSMQIVQKYQTYEKLLNRATIAYQTLVDLGQWGPSGSIRDRSGAPETMYTKVEANALAQKMVSKFKKQTNDGARQGALARKIVCYNCGKEGHRKSECRSAAKPSTSYNGNSNYRSSGYAGGGQAKSDWKKRPPRSGEPQAKTVLGEEHHWCAKCGGGRWTKTHNTSQHVTSTNTSTERRTETNAAEVNNGLYCAWAEDDDWGEVNVMEVQRDTEMGICASCGKVGYLEVRCKQGDCAEFLQDTEPSIGADSPMLQVVDEDTGEYLGKCAHCDSIGPTGLYCTSIFCEETGAIYERSPEFTLSPCRSPSPEGNLAAGIVPRNLNTYEEVKECSEGAIITPKEQHEKHQKMLRKNKKKKQKKQKQVKKIKPQPNYVKIDFGYYAETFVQEEWIQSCWSEPSQIIQFSFISHLGYTIELTWLCGMCWVQLYQATATDCPFNHQFCFYCEFSFLVWITWCNLVTRIIRYISYLVFYVTPVSFLPLFEEGRVVLMLRFTSRGSSITTPDIKPYRLEYPGFPGPAVSLLSYPNLMVVASTAKVSMQTCYGMLGPSWKSFGEHRLRHWDRSILDFYAAYQKHRASNKENIVQLSWQNKQAKKPKKNKMKKNSKSNHGESGRTVEFQEPSCFVVQAMLVEQAIDLFQDEDNEVLGEILWDTGATLSVSPYSEDFDSEIVDTKSVTVMKGIAKGLAVKGTGQVSYKVKNDKGRIVTMKSPAYYVPEATRRIFSPQAFFQYIDNKASSCQTSDGIILQLQQGRLTIPYNKTNNLPTIPIISSGSDSDNRKGSIDISTFVCVTDNSNQNLTAAQKELLKYHFRLGHVNFKCVQLILKSGHLGTSPLIKAASKCEAPRCASCRYGKAKRRSTGYQASKVPQNPVSLSSDIVRPGQRVSMDHFSVSQKGRLLDSRGRTSDEQMYTGGCLFYEHSSQYISVLLQVLMNSSQTIEAKLKFEREMFDFGVVVSNYHTDNGVFSSKQFVKEIEDNLQSIRFSGSGGHHQNGNAERSIGTIFSLTRTIMIHWAIRWPEVFDISFWPMAILYSVWIYNRVPKMNGIAPIELIVRSKNARHVLQQAHVFGCPCYVLDPKLQGLAKLPKFAPRSNRGVFWVLVRSTRR